MPNLDPLWTSVRIGSIELPNRVALAPMTRVSATEDGHATDRMASYYSRFARGGFGLLITEGIYTDTAHSQGYLFQPGLATPEQATSWIKVVDDVHARGSRIFAQLMHAGAQSQGNRFVDSTIGPSAVAPKGDLRLGGTGFHAVGLSKRVSSLVKDRTQPAWVMSRISSVNGPWWRVKRVRSP